MRGGSGEERGNLHVNLLSLVLDGGSNIFIVSQREGGTRKKKKEN